MNLIEITTTVDFEGHKTAKTLLNLEKVVAVKLLDRLVFNPERHLKWLRIQTEKEIYAIHDEVYALKVYDHLRTSAQDWTQEILNELS